MPQEASSDMYVPVDILVEAVVILLVGFLTNHKWCNVFYGAAHAGGLWFVIGVVLFLHGIWPPLGYIAAAIAIVLAILLISFARRDRKEELERAAQGVVNRFAYPGRPPKIPHLWPPQNPPPSLS